VSSSAARAVSSLAEARVLIVHEWLVTWAGSERVAEEILRVVPQADVVVAVRQEEMRERNVLTKRARETWLHRIPGARERHRWFLPLHFAAFRSLPTDAYDLIISSSHAFSKAVRPRRGQPHVCYCHSPPRYLWGLGQTYRETGGIIESAALGAATPILRMLDKVAARGVTQFVANSRFVADRIHRVYGRSAVVVYPPVFAKEVSQLPPKRDNFVLVFGRLVGYKRVDLAIRAAQQLGMPLVIAGDGPERGRLERLAGPMTRFLGDVDEATAGTLMETCRALIFCAEEDFGITPVEANAHGAPVVAFARGGILESMTADTAEFFTRLEVDDLVKAIERATARDWNDGLLRANARRFGGQRFRDEMRSVLEQQLSRQATGESPRSTA
jgi:glycosyltransferase involved in cell wall biosynthesis